jgi:hypothetical protein
MRQAALAAALALMVSTPALGLTWQVTNPDPSLAGAGIVPIEFTEQVVEIEIHKWWLQTATDGGTGEVPLVIQFTREPNDPDVLHIIDEIIFNVSEEEWLDYHVSLLDGTGLPVSPDDPNPDVWFFNHQVTDNWQMIGGSHRFESKTVTTLVGDPTRAVAFDWLDTDGQGVPAGDWFGANGPPYNQLVLSNLYIDMSQVPAGGVFYLKQVPTIPEPATAALLLTAVGLWRGVRRRR